MTTKSKCKTLIIEGTKYRTNFTKKFENRKKWKYPNEGEVTAFIPGTILKINAIVGDKLKAGDNLVVLEAMKMKNQILAPIDGVVKKINVTEGQVVSKKIILVEME